MAQKGIREFHAKRMLAKYLTELTSSVKYEGKVALVGPQTKFAELTRENPWLKSDKLVVKPDQLFGKRGKNNLLLLDADAKSAEKWIKERMNKEVTVGKSTGALTHFLIEPFTPHENEYYVAIKSSRQGDTIYFSMEGGVDVEENWDKVKEIMIPALGDVDAVNLEELISADLGSERAAVIDFIQGLHKFYRKLGYAYLEINPFTIVGSNVVPLDTVARLDDTAAFECAREWGEIEFPTPLGRASGTEEEAYIASLDEKTGASLKLTILNPEGRVWLMVAGGGASVIYTDTVVDLGAMKELANYGEYSGDPSQELTKEYASTLLKLMTKNKHPGGKVLLIGGGIANFTDVAKTFTGIIEALREYKDKLIEHNIKIYVRRGGPNYEQGLVDIKRVGDEIGVPMEVYGPETHMTKIVPRAIEALKL